MRMPDALRVDSVRAMARKAGPADEDYDSAARLGLLGLIAGQRLRLDHGAVGSPASSQ